MTVTRSYQCNLCHEAGDPDRLRGLYWKAEVAGERLVEKSSREVENHICNKCLDALKDFKSR